MQQLLSRPEPRPHQACPGETPSDAYVTCVILLAAAAGAFAWWRAYVCDDAYITFRQVRNCLDGLGPVFNPGERVQSFTHPLWYMLLLGGGTVCDLHAFAVCAGIALAVAFFLAAGRLFRNAPGRTAWLLGLGAILLTSPSWVEFLTSGLETSLNALLILLLFGSLLSAATTPPSGTGLPLVLCALLLLNRLDNVVLCAPVALWLIHRALQRGRSGWPGLVVAATLLLAWYGLATLYYGTPLPNTFYAKVAGPLGMRFERGILYVLENLRHEPLHTLLIPTALLISMVAAVKRLRSGDRTGPVLAVLAAGLCLDAGYVLAVGGDFMRGRFFLPCLTGSAVVVAYLLSDRLASTPLKSLSAAGAIAVLLAGVAKLSDYLTIAPLSGFQSLRWMERPSQVVAGAALVVVLVGWWAMARLPRGRVSRRTALAIALLQLAVLLGMAGYREMAWGMGLVFTTALLLSTILIRTPGRAAPFLPALVVIMLGAEGSLCQMLSRSNTVHTLNPVAHEYSWYAGSPGESRFRLPADFVDPAPPAWIDLGRQARRYAERWGPITIHHDALGLFAWEAGPLVHVIDQFGLADAFVARCGAIPHRRPGHVLHDIPAGYLESRGSITLLPDWEDRLRALDPTLREDALRMAAAGTWEDPEAKARWELTRRVISGPLFDPARLRAIPGFTSRRPAADVSDP